MQQPAVMAFRKRIKNLGYTNISISKEQDEKFTVTANEPLAGFLVKCQLTVTEMSHKAR